MSRSTVQAESRSFSKIHQAKRYSPFNMPSISVPLYLCCHDIKTSASSGHSLLVTPLEVLQAHQIFNHNEATVYDSLSRPSFTQNYTGRSYLSQEFFGNSCLACYRPKSQGLTLGQAYTFRQNYTIETRSETELTPLLLRFIGRVVECQMNFSRAEQETISDVKI